MKSRILIVGDQPTVAGEILKSLSASLWHGKCATARELLTLLTVDLPDAVVVIDGGDHATAASVLDRVHAIDEHIPVVILMTGSATVEAAVQFVKAGAHDYLLHPIEAGRLENLLQRAVQMYHLTKRVFLLEQQAQPPSKFERMLGQSPKMQETFQLIKTVAPTNATVLITGESGTGKELVARAIHAQSQRASHNFMDINCGAIPHNLLENELFGHEKGSYTGAEKRYIGSCERAHQGTLFLDEVCEMAPALQVKILRLLQERSFMRVGGTDRIDVDLRFIAATNRSIQEEVQNGNFREDLFYRLNVVPIHLPPLRDRRDDIPMLVYHFMERFATRLEKPFVDVEPEAMELLLHHQWPGNIRELENTIERIVVLQNDTRIKARYLPPQIQKVVKRFERPAGAVSVAPPALDLQQNVLPLDVVERYAIESALEKCVWNVGEAARRLKIGQATLYRKIRQYGLRQ